MDQTAIAQEPIAPVQPTGQEAQADAFHGIPVEEAKNRLSQYDVMRGEIEQYKAQQQISPFANDFVTKLNDLVKSGATPDHMIRFTQLQNVDLSKIEPKAAIKLEYQMKNPSLSADEIDELIDYDLGEVPDEQDDPVGYAKATRIRDTKAKMRAEESKKYLDSYKADLANVKNPEVEQRRALETGWKQVMPSLSNIEGIDVKVDLGKGLTYELPGFKPELNEGQMQAIQQNVLNQLVAQGVKLDENGMAIAKQMTNFSIKTLAHDQLLEAVIRDAWASATQEAHKSLNTKH